MFLCAPNLSGDGAACDKVRLSEILFSALSLGLKERILQLDNS